MTFASPLHRPTILVGCTLWAFLGCGGGDAGQRHAAAPPKERAAATATNGDPAKAGAEGIRAVVHANMGPMKACYRAGLARNPHLAGRIAASFTIGKDGSVSGVTDVHDTPASGDLSMSDIRAEREHPRFADRQVVECILHEFTKLHFAPQDRGSVSAVYPLTFRPPE